MFRQIFILPRTIGVFGLMILTACGGGGGGAIGEVVQEVDDMRSTGTAAITILSLDATSAETTRQGGILDFAENRLTVGEETWTANSNRTRATSGDDVITFDGPLDAVARRFNAAIGGQTTKGVAGFTPDAGNLPTGTATYSGVAVVTATAGIDIFELTGTARVTANFGEAAPTATTNISGLSGTRQTLLSAPTTLADAGTLTISGSSISDSGFSGGTTSLTSPVLVLSGGEITTLEGAFFGADGGEAGGVFAIEDGDTLIFGDFVAN